jgi:prolyl oligopeptidase
VPLTDMLRLPFMGMGAAWLDEYGDPKDPAMREAILRYSPYQNVREGVKYPPFLITSSTQDNRVGPGHARKLAGSATRSISTRTRKAATASATPWPGPT